MPETGDLTTVASIIAAFGVATLFFRIQRELEMGKAGERVWIPWADWLIVIATLCSLLLVLLPLLIFERNNLLAKAVSTSACVASVILLAGYVLAILAHYRLLFGCGRSGPRDNPEPAEMILFIVSLLVAGALSLYILIVNFKGFAS